MDYKLSAWVDQNKIDWTELSENDNPAAMHLLKQHPDKIDWLALSNNPSAIHLLEQHSDRIYWKNLSRNHAAIHILEQHPDNIDWLDLSTNPAIFEPDFQKMKCKQCAVFKEELMQRAFHPSRIAKLLASGMDLEMIEDCF